MLIIIDRGVHLGTERLRLKRLSMAAGKVIYDILTERAQTRC